MYELVPPKSKIIKYQSPFHDGVTFKLKVFDFDEDDLYTQLTLKHIKIEGDKVEYVNSEEYYLNVFKLGVKEIDGVKGKFRPSWKTIKNVVNKISEINSVVDVKK